MADVDDRRRMQPEDRFPVMSITKTMVATTVLQLVSAGQLNLDDTVEDVVPGLLPAGQRITIEHLLSHRSGLYYAGDDLPPVGRMTDDTLIDVSGAHPLEFTPGTSGSYSNVGYEVLGRVVTQVTGQSLGEAMEHGVFGPAGDATPSSSDPRPCRATPTGGRRRPLSPLFSAAGGVVSTVADIDRFFAALWRGTCSTGLVSTVSRPVGVIASSGCCRPRYLVRPRALPDGLGPRRRWSRVRNQGVDHPRRRPLGLVHGQRPRR